MNKKIDKVLDLRDMKDLLCDHEGYPRSICSHFESGSQDPSFTCGGAVGELNKGDYIFGEDVVKVIIMLDTHLSWWRESSKYNETILLFLEYSI